LKKLLLIAHSSLGTGGGEEDFLRLLKFFHNKYELIGVFPEGEKINEYKKYVKDFLIIPNRMFPFLNFNLKSYLAYIVKGNIKKKLIKIFLRKKKIDLAYIHSSVCLYEISIIHKLKIPYVVAIREFINPKFIRKLIYNFFYKTSKKIVVISKALKLEFKKNSDRSKVSLIYPGIEETNLFENGKQNDEKIILNIGYLSPLKGQSNVIRAFAELNDSDIKLKFIGEPVDNSYYNLLKSLVAQYRLNDRISFMGAMDKIEVMREIAKSFAVVISSRQEGFSLVLLEALLHKKPVVTTNVGVIPEVIIDGFNGLIYKFDDIKELNSKLTLLLNDNMLYNEISENGFETYKNNFNFKESMFKYDCLFKKLLISP
jgi:glycosyltransferase involved in cell wall biosynthesis